MQLLSRIEIFLFETKNNNEPLPAIEIVDNIYSLKPKKIYKYFFHEYNFIKILSL